VRSKKTADPLRAVRGCARRSRVQESDAPGASGDPELMLFDVRSEAICPTCGVRWRRTLNVAKLIE
jgi:hypothetical protein